MSDIARFRYEPLDTGKYETWAVYVEADLRAKNLFDGIIEISADVTDQDGNPIPQADIDATIEKKRSARSASDMAMARSAIILRVAPSQLAHCADADPLNIWFDLRSVHCPSGFAATLSHRRKLHGMKKASSQQMADWISSVKTQAFTMTNTGITVVPEDIIMTLVDGLPASFSTTVQSIGNLPQDQLTIDHVCSMLLAAEISSKPTPISSTTTNNVALAVDGEITCHFCDKKGHLKRDCLSRKKWQERGQAHVVEEEDALTAEDFEDFAY